MASIETTTRHVETGGGPPLVIGTITITNPDRRNAMTGDMYAAVPEACAALVAEDGLRVVILTGAGRRAFSAGSDISEFDERRMGREADGYDRAEHAAWDALASLAVPVIASIHGVCRGGGVAMALHADVRLCADDASFAVPPANLGLAYPPEATRRLVDLVGPGWAKRLLMTAEVIDAATAHHIGLVSEVVAADELDERVERLVASMAAKAPLSQRAAKLTVDAVMAHGSGADLPLAALSADAAAAVDACYHSEDFREGVRAFGAKRTPQFRGH